MSIKQLIKGMTDVVGLDIGSTNIKLVQLGQKNGQWCVKSASIQNINGSGHDEFNDDNIVDAIVRGCKEAGISTRYAVCGVSGPETAIRSFKFPNLQQDELEGAVMLEASQVCPFSVDDGQVDFFITSQDETNVEGILVAATNKVIERKRQLTKKANMNCVMVDVDGFALLNCLYQLTKCERNSIQSVLKIGASYSSLIIIDGTKVPFSRDIPFGCNDMYKKISEICNVPVEQVKDVLYSDTEEAVMVRSELIEPLKEACSKLITDITETIRFYAAQKKSALVENVFVCGEISQIKEFIELLGNNLPSATVAWNPFEKIECVGDEGCKELVNKKGTMLAVAAGFALRTI